MNPIKSILVATDFTDVSNYATQYAIDLAAQLGARVTLVHAYEIPVYGFLDTSMIATSDLAAGMSTAAQTAMGDVVARYKSSPVPLASVVRVGAPADEVHKVSEEVKADLIVVGTHGRRGLSRALLGSVAEVVVRTAKRPVLALHAPDAA